MRNTTATAVLDRLATAIGAKNDSALAKALKTTPSTVSTWKSRDSIPYAICVDMALARDISLDWLLAGEGQMRRGATHLAAGSPLEESLLTLFRGLPEGGQSAIHYVTEQTRRLQAIEQRLEAADLTARLHAP